MCNAAVTTLQRDTLLLLGGDMGRPVCVCERTCLHWDEEAGEGRLSQRITDASGWPRRLKGRAEFTQGCRRRRVRLSQSEEQMESSSYQGHAHVCTHTRIFLLSFQAFSIFPLLLSTPQVSNFLRQPPPARQSGSGGLRSVCP